MTLRKFGSKSVVDLKSEPSLKSLIRSELKELINHSVHDYLQKNKIPIATIDINVDKDCNNYRLHSQGESGMTLRLNISTTPMDTFSEPNKSALEDKIETKKEDHSHWMTWKSYDDGQFNTKPKNIKNYHCNTHISTNGYRGSSPFQRPSTTAGSSDCRGVGTMYRSSSIEPKRTARFNDSEKITHRPKTSVAVGPDKHFEEKGTNTQQSYQVSDYLRKNMNLNDSYERNVYSSLMEVMRKRTNHSCEVPSEPGSMDPVIQISEYKYKYQNPRSLKVVIPSSNNQSLFTVKKPPLCPHKTRPLGQLRPQTSFTQKCRYGEQFLF